MEDIRSHRGYWLIDLPAPFRPSTPWDGTLTWQHRPTLVSSRLSIPGASPNSLNVRSGVAHQRNSRRSGCSPPQLSPRVTTQLPVLQAAFQRTNSGCGLGTGSSAGCNSLSFQADLIDRARSNPKRLWLAPEPEDDRVLRAAAIVLRRGIADLVLLSAMRRQSTRVESFRPLPFPSTTCIRRALCGRVSRLRSRRA